MRSKKRPLLLILFLLLISVVFGFDWDALASVRNVEVIKIFASGVLTGLLICTSVDLIRERRKGEG